MLLYGQTMKSPDGRNAYGVELHILRKSEFRAYDKVPRTEHDFPQGTLKKITNIFRKCSRDKRSSSKQDAESHHRGPVALSTLSPVAQHSRRAIWAEEPVTQTDCATSLAVRARSGDPLITLLSCPIARS